MKIVDERYKVALVWHGDSDARATASLRGNRLERLGEALLAAGIEPIPVVYNDECSDEVREQLLGMDGALVWVNPIENGRNRATFDALLRQVSDAGVFVSAHPDVILAMGTKEVLFRTREMGWGSDTHLYSSARELCEQLPLRLSGGRPRVLKQYRGNGGNGVWKVTPHQSDATLVHVRHALRGSDEEEIPLAEFLSRCEAYFADGGRLIDQEYQQRLIDGMVRCYLAGDRVAGFGFQEINALYPPPQGAPPGDPPPPGPRLYHPPTDPRFQDIKASMEQEWLGDLCRTLGLARESLPVIWDADFLFGPRTASGENTHVLCEINVSSVYPFPDAALEPLARLTAVRLAAHRSTPAVGACEDIPNETIDLVR